MCVVVCGLTEAVESEIEIRVFACVCKLQRQIQTVGFGADRRHLKPNHANDLKKPVAMSKHGSRWDRYLLCAGGVSVAGVRKRFRGRSRCGVCCGRLKTLQNARKRSVVSSHSQDGVEASVSTDWLSVD